MSNANQKSKLSEILERLQVESWQLELLVSGFAIFLVAASFEPVLNFGRTLRVIAESLEGFYNILFLIPIILLGATFFLFINLILHVIFRGLWISAIGLRYVSGDIDFDELRLQNPFHQFLTRRLGSFDNFIERLENISSVLFAFTFLIVFMLLSLGLFSLLTGLMQLLVEYIGKHWLSDARTELLGGLTLFVLLFTGFLYFLDFVTIGFFKRKRWITIWYYPIYRFYSLVTFSWLYRPLYYNLIDNKFGRRIGLILVPYFFLIVTLATLFVNRYNYIPSNATDHTHYQQMFYADQRAERKRIDRISLPSRFTNNGYLELFLRHYPLVDNPVIERLCAGIRPAQLAGLRVSIIQVNTGKKEIPPDPDSLLQCMGMLYQIAINDSIFQQPEYLFYESQQFSEAGLQTILDVAYLPRGRHQLRVDVQRLGGENRDSLYWRKFAQIPFWRD